MKINRLTEHLKKGKAVVSRFGVLAGLSLALLICGCQAQQPIVPGDLSPSAISGQAVAPGYTKLMQRYNQNISQFSRIWSHVEAEMHWKNSKGQRKAENGTGVLIVVRPDKLAFTIGKLGHAGMWAGSNDKRYWMFNLRDDVAYTGLNKNIGKPCTQQFPLPVPPEAVPYLLGIVPVDPFKVPPAPAVQMYRGFALVQPPGLHVRMLINPKTAQPVRIDWLDDHGKSILVCLLSGRYNVKIQGVPPAERPRLARDIKIYAPGKIARLNLRLNDVSDGKQGDKIRPGVFNWQVLKQAHQPEKIINLDGNCK